MRNRHPLLVGTSRRTVAAGIGLLATALSATAQTNQNAQPGTRPGTQGSQQTGIGGPPVGQQQQQQLQQRQQQIQQSQQQGQQQGQGQGQPGQSQPGQGQPGQGQQRQGQGQQRQGQGQQGQGQGQGQQGQGQNGGGAQLGAVGTGTVGEPSGTTTPQAQFGNSPSTGNVIGAGQPTGAARTLAVAPATLTLPEAITIGIDNNLTTLLANERAEEARAMRQQLRSFLLPNLFGTAYQQNRTLNLAAQGLSSGSSDTGGMMPPGGPGMPPGGAAAGIPSFVGPFYTFDARLNFSQALLDLSSLRQYRSSKVAVVVADLTAQLAREQVATFVSLAYLTAQRGDLDVRAARADFILAENLLKLARQQRDVGVANGIDVVRAESRVAQQRLRVVQAEASAVQDRLDLERAVGLPQGSSTVLTDTLAARAEVIPNVEAALPAAQAARLDARVAEQTIEERILDRRGRAAARIPVITAAADYGQSATKPFKNDRGTRTLGVTLNVPIFDGGYIGGRVKAALSEQRQAELQLGNTRGQVEQDVRQALIAWNLALAQLRSADEQLDIANRELALAVQRFRAGVADNLEVLQAQAGLANARALRVQALAQYGAARLNFAASTGTAQSFRL